MRRLYGHQGCAFFTGEDSVATLELLVAEDSPVMLQQEMFAFTAFISKDEVLKSIHYHDAMPDVLAAPTQRRAQQQLSFRIGGYLKVMPRGKAFTAEEAESLELISLYFRTKKMPFYVAAVRERTYEFLFGYDAQGREIS